VTRLFNTAFLKPFIRRLLIAALSGAACSALAQEDNFKPFTADSFAAIKQRYAGQEFLLGLWSVDCPPCLVELDMMGQLLKLNPDLPFVLISTDSIADRDSALEFLEDFELDTIESWMFADSFEERLRFSIDPSWYGELPRSYFFDEQHTQKSHSGIMSRELLEEWFAREIRFE
jgi:thiol-disulfide isomerase/thioredoxin